MKKLWISLAAVVVVSFLVLGWIGTRIYEEKPPIPARIVDSTGKVVVADGDIGHGQNVWQALGGLIRPAFAARSALLSTTIFLSGGIIGTCHHLYFSGTPAVALAFGSVFSALEVVPLTMVAYSAIDDLRNGRLAPWVRRYQWPIYYFVAVAFWNMVGAGLFGFMINPPIALYYMQGLNTTPLHGHAALFGVYGMLGIGLMLVCLRAMDTRAEWKESWLKFSFWGINAGLFIMCVGSLLPVGLAQTWASVEKGYWYARSTEFLGLPFMQTLRWMRVPGDTIFAIAALVLVAFVFIGRRTAVSDAKEPADAIRVPAGD
jgi:nitric oxide reductase subunit B